LMFLLAVVVGCTDDDGDATNRPGGTEEASVAAVHDLIEGRHGDFYDLLHPGLKAQRARGDYVDCARGPAGPVPAFGADRFRPARVDSVVVVETGDARYTTRAGEELSARTYTVRMEGGLESIDLVVTWIEADGRWAIVEVEGPEDSDEPDACVRWL
jgi:hypothetical protein